MADLQTDYGNRLHYALEPIAVALQKQISEYLAGIPRIDRISARPKSMASFLKKAATIEGGRQKYSEPLREIQDQIGVRVVTFYLSDVEAVANAVGRYYRPIEHRHKIPDSESEFGYFGRHFIFLLPNGLVKPAPDKSIVPEVFELQIKTLFQHAWSEGGHDLGYKPGGKEPDPDQKRLMAYASAQAWGADRVFDELYRTLQK